MAAGDLDRDGRIEVVATTTNTSDSGSQVFAFTAAGPRCPAGHVDGAEPGYAAYGENVGIGNLDDDPPARGRRTFDNHQIHLFNHDGTSVLAAPWFKDRQTGARLGWGDYIRWLSARVEADHLHKHVGEWPHPARKAWLQWTASPPSIGDLDRDGRNEVIGIPNVEKHVPYETQAYAFMVLDGAQRGGRRSARRHKGFTRLPLTSKPAVRGDGDWYPPSGIPAPTLVNLRGNRRPEIVASIPDGFVYAISPSGRRLWRYDYAHGAPKTFASEVVAADITGNRRPELIFGTYGLTATRAASSSCPRGAGASTTCACATRAATATASASPPRRRSPTSTATAGSRSWSPRSTTGSTSTAPPSAPSAPRGRPAAATCSAAVPEHPPSQGLGRRPAAVPSARMSRKTTLVAALGAAAMIAGALGPWATERALFGQSEPARHGSRRAGRDPAGADGDGARARRPADAARRVRAGGGAVVSRWSCTASPAP